MKKILLITLSAAVLAACSIDKPDAEKARQLVEDCLKDIAKGDVKNLRDKYYSLDFQQTETEVRVEEKFKSLKMIAGAMTAFELQQTMMEQGTGEADRVKLAYQVRHDKITTYEEFVVILEEGKYKIGSHLISKE